MVSAVALALVAPASELTVDEIRRYSRHLIIPDVGMDGQKRLKNAKVLVVGAGGVGGSVSTAGRGAGGSGAGTGAGGGASTTGFGTAGVGAGRFSTTFGAGGFGAGATCSTRGFGGGLGAGFSSATGRTGAPTSSTAARRTRFLNTS